MSHELADRLDGIETSGHVEVRPSTSYKFHLPSKPASKVPEVPDLRWSKLFTTVEPEAFLNESPFFRIHPKAPATRSKSVGNATTAVEELRLAHPGEEVELPLSEMKIKAVKEEFPPLPTDKEVPFAGVEVCDVCGNTPTIWGPCGCITEIRRNSNGSGCVRVPVPIEKIPASMSLPMPMSMTMPMPMDQAPPVPRKSTLRRIRKRGMTLRRIRTRVVRALTV
jgi:hypothetical protein